MKTRPVTAVEWLLYVAESQVGVTETPPNSNAGLKVETYQKTTGNVKGAPWCCSAMVWCFDYAGIAWPWVRSGLVTAVVADARAKGQVFVSAVAQPGDLFALWFPKLNRHAHIGVLVSRGAGDRWATYEGNTDDDGGRDGWGFFARSGARGRTLTEKDVVLRWG